MNTAPITKKLDSFLALGSPGYDAVIYDGNGKCVYRHQNGVSDVETGAPVDPNASYYLYSCSKPITCASALQLWERGAFSLDDPISRYLPEFSSMTVREADGTLVPAARPITVKDLFCMSAGFSYDLNSPELLRARKETNGRCPTREVMKYLSREPLHFHPGEHYRYSLCHDVLAALVEVVSDTLFADYVKTHIFDVLGMSHSTFLPTEADKARTVPLYAYNAETKSVYRRTDGNLYLLGSEYASGGAGCVSTVDDYMLFADAMRRGNVILKNETLDMMSSPHIPPALQNDYGAVSCYTYGLGVRVPRAGMGRTDFGWSGAAGSYAIFDRVANYSAFIAMHVTGCAPVVAVRSPIANIMRDCLLGKD